MRTNLAVYRNAQVFLNYPFDRGFERFANAMHFGVVAAGLIPVCSCDLSVPDRPRLDMLVDTITNCHYSAHDFSRFTGEGPDNFARFNMPIEMGMALFHALQTQRVGHRCAFFVSTKHDYLSFASDLAGLDPKHYDSDELKLVVSVYDWLRDVARPLATELPTVRVKEKYEYFRESVERLDGNGIDGEASHNETQELMFQICSECKWWEWRGNRLGTLEFPPLPLSWKDKPS